ncbi:DUF3667 domain-containing protein [Maribacter halichondriae]|uniref:DUF3667 domain-containing protein n=1 Tax=Maribacter halichondriae TaxID=2980554 RepID=UPI002358A50F|nr:DUF3667 domain-containing protein [Maribacter sp. Hal144]
MECKNCQSTLAERADYCSFCGAKIIRNRLNLRNLWTEFTEQYLNLDNTFLRTIKHLFTKPKEVILGYINGQRKRYLNPISLYAIALTFTGILFF